MLEKSALSDEKIIAALRESYGLDITNLTFLPIGNDATARVYKASTGRETAYFLKIKTGHIHEPAVTIPRLLRNRGIEQVVASLPTRSQALWHKVDEFTLILYPFIEGSDGMTIGLTDRQWIEYGRVLKQIHATPLSPALSQQVRKETFVPQWMAALHTLDAKIQGNTADDPYQKDLAAFWQSRAEEIRRIATRSAALGQMLQQQAPELALCHADIHTANILLDHTGKMFIIDWDETILAPVERDLMFIVNDTIAGEPINPQHEAHFFEGYGKTDINWLALAYYRYEWVVQEIGDFGNRVFFMDDAGAEIRQDAVRGFIQLFNPGDVVEGAYQSEKMLL